MEFEFPARCTRPSEKMHSSQDRRPGDQGLSAFEPDVRSPDIPEYRYSGVIEAAQRLEHLCQARGEKQRFEFVLPVRVGRALAEDARKSGMSATRKLLEILRDAGLPVLDEDLLDLRKE